MIRAARSKIPAFTSTCAAIAALSLVSTAPAAAEESDDQVETELTEGEQRLAKLLEGREAGEPRDCIRDLPNSRLTTIEDTAYVYGQGGTIYVQRTLDPDQIDDDDALVIRRHNGTRLCRLDLATTVDRFNGFFTGVVRFDQFVPYKRVADSSD